MLIIPTLPEPTPVMRRRSLVNEEELNNRAEFINNRTVGRSENPEGQVGLQVSEDSNLVIT